MSPISSTGSNSNVIPPTTLHHQPPTNGTTIRISRTGNSSKEDIGTGHTNPPSKKTTSSSLSANNSVETTERCSTDGTDPTVMVVTTTTGISRSGGTNSTSTTISPPSTGPELSQRTTTATTTTTATANTTTTTSHNALLPTPHLPTHRPPLAAKQALPPPSSSSKVSTTMQLPTHSITTTTSANGTGSTNSMSSGSHRSVGNPKKNHSGSRKNPIITQPPRHTATATTDRTDATPTLSTTTGTPTVVATSTTTITVSPPLRSSSLPPTPRSKPSSSPQQQQHLPTPTVPSSQRPLTIEQQEQMIFVQRIMDTQLGLAVRKINQYGKSNLRYVKCLTVVATAEQEQQYRHHHGDAATTTTTTASHTIINQSPTPPHSLPSSNSSSGAAAGGSGNFGRGRTAQSFLSSSVPSSRSFSGGSHGGAHPHLHHNKNTASTSPRSYQVLSWGKKKDVQIPLRLFIAVRKGKTTDRAKRCTSVPANRIVSIISCDPYHPSLDIEAPTTMDRNKFARAFAQFLNVPLFEEDNRHGTYVSTTIVSSSSPATASPSPATTPNTMTYHHHQEKSDQDDMALSPPLPPHPSKVVPSDPEQYAPQPVANIPTTTTTTPIINVQSEEMKNGETDHQPMEVFATSPFLQFRNDNTDPDTTEFEHKGNNQNDNLHHPSNGIQAAEATTMTTTTIASRGDDSAFSSYHNYTDALESEQPVIFHPMDGTNDNNNNDFQINGNDVSNRTTQPPRAATTHIVNTSGAIVSDIPDIENDIQNDDRTHMSSLTGHGYDQELVEELHHALNELRAELEESRAEASRAVKVAEQAIQSAERNNSTEWHNTVTHKAAEAAALAQKRSAAAMAKQRIAEERLEKERRAAIFWRKQAEIAEEEAGSLQTRAAAAEVQRAAIEELLKHERRMMTEQITVLRGRYTSTDVSQRDALEAALERNRALDMELDATRRDLQLKQNEINQVMDTFNEDDNHLNSKNRKLKRNFGRKKKGSVDGNDSTSLLSDHIMNSSSSSALMSLDQLENCAPPSNFSYNNSNHMNSLEGMGLSTEQVLRIHAETQLMRQQFELLKRATADHLEQLPENVRVWGQQISQSLQSSQAEVARLQMKLAMECASRRKLLNEVQDLRGAVRVYCRPKPSNQDDEYMELPSHDSILFHRDKYDDEHGPVSFEFDRVFDPNNAKQQDVYAEVQDVCLGVLDGYNICIMAYGPNQCGKTTTIFGNIDIVNRDSIQIQNYGIHLQAMHQLFTIAEHRSERYKDVFSLTIIEVHNERIRDLIAATETGSRCGHVMIAETKNGMTGNINVNRKQKTSVDNDDASSGRPSKLEIRTDIHGDTVIQGLVTVEVNSMAEVLSLWQECIAVKVRRLEEQGVDISKYDAANHVIATLRVKSHNIATGVGTIGKIQFVDFAAADIIPRNQSVPDGSTDDTTAITVTGTTTYMNQNEWKFANRSLETFCECIEARMQFDRNVPYRNSTLTHLLRDSLESDTKVILFACISSDPTHMNETTAVLKFASQLRRVIIGKATKHILSSS